MANIPNIRENVQKNSYDLNLENEYINDDNGTLLSLPSTQTLSFISQGSSKSNFSSDYQKNKIKKVVSKESSKTKVKASKKRKKNETISGEEEILFVPDDDFESAINWDNGEELDNSLGENPVSYPNDFDMTEFRSKLLGRNFIDDVRQFLFLVEHDKQIIFNYLKMNGTPLQLAKTLERINKSNLTHVYYICQAVDAVLTDIMFNHRTYMESAINASRYILKLHNFQIEQLLQSMQKMHRRIALKLLKTIVQLNMFLAKLCLSTFGIFSDLNKIKKYLSHSRSDQPKRETVRKCYIDFVLAFLTDENSMLVKSLLSRKALVQALIYGLIYDDHKTVCLVLNKLKLHVLENGNISKTTKMFVFDLECCKRLLYLYDWLGPRFFSARVGSKYTFNTGEEGERLSKTEFNSLVNLEEKEAVSACAHEFLLTLLGSHKDGITFDPTKRLWQKQNIIQGKLIRYMQKPWACERKTELIHKILLSNIYHAKQTVYHFTTTFHFAGIKRSDFIDIAKFLCGIFSALQSEQLRNELNQMPLSDLLNWIKDTCLPLDTLIQLRHTNMLNSSSLNCRLMTHRLLLAMFTQYSNFITFASQRTQSTISSTGLRRLKFELCNHILLNFPSIDHILQSLNKTMKYTSKFNANVVTEHLDVTLDLILILCKQNPSSVNLTNNILNYLNFIRPLYAGEEDSDDILKRNSLWTNHCDIKLELKAIKTILLLIPNALNTFPELFSCVLKSFIRSFVHESEDVQQEAVNLLKEIFKNAGIFDTLSLEIDLWFEALRWFDPVTIEIVTKVFMEVLKDDQTGITLPTPIETETSKFAGLSKLLALVLKSVQNVQPLDKYIGQVSLLLFHYYPKPEYVANLYETKLKTLPEYMRTWLSAGNRAPELKNLKLPSVCNQIPFLKQLQVALLIDYAHTNFEKVFASNDATAFEFKPIHKKRKLHKVLKNERLLVIYIQQVIFFVMQLLKKQQLMRIQATLAAKFVINFLILLHKIKQENNINDVFDTDDVDSIVKQSFFSRILIYIYDVQFGCLKNSDLVNAKSEHTVNIIHFIILISEYCSKQPDFSVYIKNFRLKILKAVEISMDTMNLTMKQSNAVFIKMIVTVQLNAENSLDLLDTICKNVQFSHLIQRTNGGTQPSFYYNLLIFALKRLTDLNQPDLSGKLVKVVAKYYAYFIRNLSTESNVESFGEVFFNFLTIKEQCIPEQDWTIFECMFKAQKVEKSCINIATFLLERSNNLNERFFNLLSTHISKRELVYPLLEIVFKKKIDIDPTMQANIYHEYGNGLLQAIETPTNAEAIYIEYSTCSIALINVCMPVTDCMDFCNTNFVIDEASEPYRIRCIYAIYDKALEALKKDNKDKRAIIFVNYLSLQIQLLSNDLKNNALPVDKLQLYTYQIFNWFTKIHRPTTAMYKGFKDIIGDQHWQTFFYDCLELCLQTEEITEHLETQHGFLLKFAAFLCDNFFMDYENTRFPRSVQPNEPTELFHLITKHPKYYGILLSIKKTQTKAAMLCLLLTLAKKSPMLVLRNLDVSAIIGAHRAEFSEADRYILALLRLYEQYYADEFQKFRPFVWDKKDIGSIKDLKPIIAIENVYMSYENEIPTA